MDSRYYFVIAVSLYGIASFLHRIAATKIGISNVQIVSVVVSILALPIILGYLKHDYHKFEFYGLAISIVASILAAIGNILVFNGLAKATNAGSLGVMISLYPVISLILAVIFLHEQITLQKAIATCLMIIGAVTLALT